MEIRAYCKDQQMDLLELKRLYFEEEISTFLHKRGGAQFLW